MSNAISKLLNAVNDENADGKKPISQMTPKPIKQKPGLKSRTSVEPEISVVSPQELNPDSIKVIVQNQPRIYEKGYSLEIIAREYALILENVMLANNISCVSVDAMGVFHTLGIKYKNFSLIIDPLTDKPYYVLKSLNRTAYLKDLLAELGRKYEAPILSVNYERKVKLNLPLNLTNAISEAEAKIGELTCETLFMTTQEAKELKFGFIDKISHYKEDEKNLLIISYNLQNLFVTDNSSSENVEIYDNDEVNKE